MNDLGLVRLVSHDGSIVENRRDPFARQGIVASVVVAPEHNLAEWNTRKMLFAHLPNLVCTLAYLAAYGNGGMFVLFQTVALLGSTYFMRFPRYLAASAKAVKSRRARPR